MSLITQWLFSQTNRIISINEAAPWRPLPTAARRFGPACRHLRDEPLLPKAPPAPAAESATGGGGVFGEPLEDGGLGLGVNGQADRFLHGAVGDRFRDAALLAAGWVLLRCGHRGTALRVRGGRRRAGLQPAVAA